MNFILLIASLVVVVRANSATLLAKSPQLLGWKFEKCAHPFNLVDLSIELEQPRLIELKSKLAAISDPINSNYGKHLAKDESEWYHEPDSVALETVIVWLRAHGIMSPRIEGPSIKFETSVKTVKQLVDADVGLYSYGSSVALRAPNYTLPDHVAEYIRFIHPLTHFAKPVRSSAKDISGHYIPFQREVSHEKVVRSTNKPAPYLVARQDKDTSGGPCYDGVTPECLRILYGLPSANDMKILTPHTRTRFAVAGFLEQYISYEDVSSFLKQHAPDIHAMGYNFTISLLNGAINPQAPQTIGGEACLDMDYAVTLGYPANITFYGVAGRGKKLENGTLLPIEESDNEPYLELLQGLLELSDDEVPHVLSISYADDEDSIPIDYAIKVCDLFAELSARGTSIFTASGDGGAAGTGQGKCYDSLGRKAFVPTFPASCPYVTSVGATGYSTPFKGALVSSGGFSNIFSTPEWQKSASAEYIKSMDGAHRGLYNASGRAIPDISAPGELVTMISSGTERQVTGTSASTPMIAALVALVNEERFKAGRSSLGWLNPLLYTNRVRTALVDVTLGSNAPCIFDGDNDTEPGFSATEGYDCVTGLGSVGEFGKFLSVLL